MWTIECIVNRIEIDFERMDNNNNNGKKTVSLQQTKKANGNKQIVQ